MCVLIPNFLTNFTELDFGKGFGIFDVIVSSCEVGIRKVGLCRVRYTSVGVMVVFIIFLGCVRYIVFLLIRMVGI